jgi:hypothetical protein
MKAILFLLAGTLAACQPYQASAPDHTPPPPHRGVGTGAGSSGSAGSAGSGAGAGAGHMMGKDSWYGMCALNRRIMAARTPEERQAIAEQAMPNMSPESRERHLLMMQLRCQ